MTDDELDTLYFGWALIANASDWLNDTPQSASWVAAAISWRDARCFPILERYFNLKEPYAMEIDG